MLLVFNMRMSLIYGQQGYSNLGESAKKNVIVSLIGQILTTSSEVINLVGLPGQ
jgi:hypothetical protein